MEPNQCYYIYHNQTKIKCNLTYFAIYHFVKDREIRRKKTRTCIINAHICFTLYIFYAQYRFYSTSKFEII